MSSGRGTFSAGRAALEEPLPRGLPLPHPGWLLATLITVPVVIPTVTEPWMRALKDAGCLGFTRERRRSVCGTVLPSLGSSLTTWFCKWQLCCWVESSQTKEVVTAGV